MTRNPYRTDSFLRARAGACIPCRRSRTDRWGRCRSRSASTDCTRAKVRCHHALSWGGERPNLRTQRATPRRGLPCFAPADETVLVVLSRRNLSLHRGGLCKPQAALLGICILNVDNRHQAPGTCRQPRVVTRSATDNSDEPVVLGTCPSIPRALLSREARRPRKIGTARATCARLPSSTRSPRRQRTR